MLASNNTHPFLQLFVSWASTQSTTATVRLWKGEFIGNSRLKGFLKE